MGKVAERMKQAADYGEDCFGMTVEYLQGLSYSGKYTDLEAAREGDLLLFTGKDGACLVLYGGNGRGYSVVGGKTAIVRIKDVLLEQKFLAGVTFG